jgi:hypothetical protein
MRLVLIRSRNLSPYYDPEIQEPLGLEYLAAWRMAKGDAVLVMDSTIENAGDIKMARRAASFQPDAIGFSITTAQELASIHAIYRECRRALGERPVGWIAGGNFVSSEPAQAERLLPAEFALVRFEGENALDDWMTSRETASGGPDGRVASRETAGGGPEGRVAPRENAGGGADDWMASRETASGGPDGRVASRETASGGPDGRVRPGTAIEDLDSLPFAARPFANEVLARGGVFNLQGSRGCHGACRYCSSPGMAAARGWRGRSAAHVAEEIAMLHRRYRARSFNFVDEDFLGADRVAADRARAFAAELTRRGLRVAFSVQVRPGTLSAEAIDALAAVGLVYVFVGIESDDREDFRRWARPWTPDPWSRVALLRARGVEVNAGVLLFHRHSTFAGIRRFAESLHSNRLLEYRSATNRLDAAPGSQIYREAAAAGQIDADLPGPRPLPYLEPRIDAFHAELREALAPLGPPAMQAVCSLPRALVRQRFDERTGADVPELLRIERRMDEAVAGTLFSLLDVHEKGTGAPGLVAEWRRRNLELACECSRELAAAGFAQSFESLRQAIRIDAGV